MLDGVSLFRIACGVLVASGVGVACAAILDVNDVQYASPGDANTSDATADVRDLGDGNAGAELACDPTKPFGPAVLLSELNSAADDGPPRLSTDELTLVMHSNRADPAGVRYLVYEARRVTRDAPFDP